MSAALSLSKVKGAVRTAYYAAYRTARRSGVRSIHSRGRYLATIGGEGDQRDQCDPYPGAEAIEWRGTLKELLAAVHIISNGYPNVKELWIEGGFDGAENPREFMDGLYDPWVGTWEVLVWTRKNGFEICLSN